MHKNFYSQEKGEGKEKTYRQLRRSLLFVGGVIITFEVMSDCAHTLNLYQIVLRLRTQHRSGFNLIPGVHRKEHLSMNHSTQPTMTEKAVLKEQECLAKSAGSTPKRTRSGRVVRPSLRYMD